MTLLFVYTILMAVFNIANGIFTYKIYKHLTLDINMGKVKKGFKKVKAMESIDSQEKDGDSLGANEEFDGTFSNSFSDRELSFIKAAEILYKAPSLMNTIYPTPNPDEKITFQ